MAYGGFDAKFYADIVNNGSIISVGRNLNVTGQSSENLLELKNNNLIETRSSTMNLINDYGSEDLTATLTRKNDSIYILKQEDGSTIKVPRNSKWQKLPKTLEFKRRK